MPLKAAELRALQPSDTPYRKSDGKGLYLEIYPNGSKLWRFKYRVNGKEKRFSLGAWPEVTLANARKKRSEFRLAVLDGRDPSLERKKRKRVARINASHSLASCGTGPDQEYGLYP